MVVLSVDHVLELSDLMLVVVLDYGYLSCP